MEFDMADRTCSLAGCENPHRSRGYCNGHYQRLMRDGDPGSVDLKNNGQSGKRGLCSVLDCDKVHASRGFCAMHRYRFVENGDPSVVKVRLRAPGRANPNWVGDEVKYGGAHYRVRSLHGAPSIHQCAHCTGQAADWAYINGSPRELIDDAGRRYSPNPADYIPLCRSCHRIYDYGYDAWLAMGNN